MMMVDLGSFSDQKFDPQKWINAACQSRHPQDPLDKHLVDLEMKLQMVSEEIASSLEEQSAAALLRVPRATRDVIRLRDDALSLRSSLSAIFLKLKKAEGSSAESVVTLAKVDSVKQRMEAAYETLQDAAGLTQLSSTVEEVFSSGDLPRAAETLANMRHCLSAVGEVAEFANIRRQLEVLEDRLDSVVQSRLTDALSNRRVDVAQEMRAILLRIGRFKSLELHYTKVHLKPIQQLWEDFDLRQQAKKVANAKSEIDRVSNSQDFQSSMISFSSWLPSFYDELLLYLEQEWKWCLFAFPEEYRTLVPKLLIETMSAITVSFASQINLATGDAVPETKALAKGIIEISNGDLPKGAKIQTKHLEALIELHNTTGSFARNIQHLFSDADPQVVLDALKAVYFPYESFKRRYGQMERAVLSGEIAGLDLRGAAVTLVGVQGVELSETIRRMEESIPQVILLLEAAVERCINFTGGSEVDELIIALDDVMLQYISTLQENVKSLRAVCGLDVDAISTKKDTGAERREAASNARKVDFTSGEEEWSFVQGALQILTVADCLTSRSSVFEASLKATLARLSTSLSLSVSRSSIDQNKPDVVNDDGTGQLSVAQKAALDVAAVRLVDIPEKARKLLNLLEQSKDPRFHALPVASQRVTAFTDAVNDLVYDVLISKIRQHFNDLSRLPIWSSVEEHHARPLPTFSSYPQSYVTAVGEYLLTLPQQLEPLGENISNSDPNADEAQYFATEWMFKVAEGATALYMEQLRGIQYIMDRGAQQLSVDIEYLSNVLSALSMPIPTCLATFQTCFSTPKDQLKDLITSDSGDQLDLPTANLVCKMRQIRLE
ncbi:conserved oligomeric Golgi complex subunit 7 [Capsicum annuum]|uniref:conserved oligomeric Golgi complex subunit 7 n=1 Tax=Capsicum annuum TaxID=4072 RepID=UPI0007BF7CE7|nr:conserved oligomeric Golgi complex subunit 7 [Capsicum annuum]